MFSLFKWLRSSVRDAILGGINDAGQAVAAQINGYADAPPPPLTFLGQPVQPPALPKPEPVPVPVPVQEVTVPPSPLDGLRDQARALRAEGMAPSKIARKLKLDPAQVRSLIS